MFLCLINNNIKSNDASKSNNNIYSGKINKNKFIQLVGQNK